MMVKSVFLIAAAASVSSGWQDKLVSVVVVVAAVLLVLNQFGLLPRGQTAERLKLDLEVADRDREQLEGKLQRLTSEVAELKGRPNLDEHARLLAKLVESFQDHDLRMVQAAQNGAQLSVELMKVADKMLKEVNAIAVAVIPPAHIRDD